MSPDMKRLCDCFADPGLNVFGVLTDGEREAIVRAVLTELREVSENTEGYRKGLWTRGDVDALVSEILAEPATA